MGDLFNDNVKKLIFYTNWSGTKRRYRILFVRSSLKTRHDMEASTEKVLESNRNAFVPAVMAIGVASIVCSYAINNYWGMTLAMTA